MNYTYLHHALARFLRQLRMPFCTLLWIVVCSSCLSAHPRLHIMEATELPKAIAVAEQMGYTPAAELVRVRHCAPNLISRALNCYLEVAYEVDMAVSDFSALVADLTFQRTGYSTGDGRELLQELNYAYYLLPEEEMHPPLMIDGNTGYISKEQPQVLPEFLKYYWDFWYSEERWLKIAFYETAPLANHPTLGERVVQGNIAVVTLEMGIVVPN